LVVGAIGGVSDLTTIAEHTRAITWASFGFAFIGFCTVLYFRLTRPALHVRQRALAATALTVCGLVSVVTAGDLYGLQITRAPGTATTTGMRFDGAGATTSLPAATTTNQLTVTGDAGPDPMADPAQTATGDPKPRLDGGTSLPWPMRGGPPKTSGAFHGTWHGTVSVPALGINVGQGAVTLGTEKSGYHLKYENRWVISCCGAILRKWSGPLIATPQACLDAKIDAESESAVVKDEYCYINRKGDTILFFRVLSMTDDIPLVDAYLWALDPTQTASN
jgi:hypothetical protein